MPLSPSPLWDSWSRRSGCSQQPCGRPSSRELWLIMGCLRSLFPWLQTLFQSFSTLVRGPSSPWASEHGWARSLSWHFKNWSVIIFYIVTKNMTVDWYEDRNDVGRKFEVFSAFVVLSHRCFVVAADPGVVSGWSDCWLWAHSATPGQSANTHRSMGNGGEFGVLLLQLNRKKHIARSEVLCQMNNGGVMCSIFS